MDAPRNRGHTVPIMGFAPTNPVTKQPQNINIDDLEDEGTALEDIDLNTQSTRAVGKNTKGKFEVPRTECWKRFSTKPHHHVLNCGHVVATAAPVACGLNCRLRSKAKYHPDGNMIKCGPCLDRQKQAASPFIPKKRPRRNSASDGGMAKMKVDKDDEALSDEHSMETLRADLAKAASRQTIIEPPLPVNPRKRRAVEEPGFHLHDHPTGELPKSRRNSTRASNSNQFSVAPNSNPLNSDKQECICDGVMNEEILMCTWCEQFFHPTCAGHPGLTHIQFYKFSSGFENFYCQGCKEDKDMQALRKKAKKKAKEGERANKKATAASVMVEADAERKKNVGAKEGRKSTVKKEIMKAEPKVRGRGRTRKVDTEGEKMEVDAPKPPLKSISKRTTSTGPPPPEERFRLTLRKSGRSKSRDRMEID